MLGRPYEYCCGSARNAVDPSRRVVFLAELQSMKEMRILNKCSNERELMSDEGVQRGLVIGMCD